MVEKQGKILSNSFTSDVKNWLKSNPGNYLEIGSYDGIFISQLGEEYPNLYFFSIDPFISDGYTGQEIGTLLSEQHSNFLFNTNSLSNIKLYNFTTQECLKNKVYLDIEDISCILIDGSHIYEDVKIDFEFIQKIKRNRDILVIIDDLHIKDVVKACNEFLETLDEDSFAILKSSSPHYKKIILKKENG